MLKIDNFEVLGWEHAVRGMRNPMNSWKKSDSGIGCSVDFVDRICAECDRSTPCVMEQKVVLGPNDHDLMMRLAKGGPVHAKYRRMITVYVDITAPLYWWKEFDTYKVGTVANSCSTMHKIAEKRFTLDDFSIDHLNDNALDDPSGLIDVFNDGMNKELMAPIRIIELTIDMLNQMRNGYLSATEDLKKAKNPVDISSLKNLQKKYWWQMIQLLPSSYNQKRTVMLNYEVLTNIYKFRKDHKLDEWHTFCHWIEELPYSEIILGHYSDEEE